MTDTDSYLLEQMRRGDDLAFEALYLRHHSGVYRVLYGLLRVREWTEDLLQETFLELYRNPPALRAENSLISWLCRVALNRGYNALRGEGRSKERIERTVSLEQSPDPAIEVLRAEENSRVRVVLARLPAHQGKLLLLRYAGLSYAECAAALEVAPGSIGTLLVRAERAFREAYSVSEGSGQPDLLERTAT